MSVPLELLALTESRALFAGAYGTAGTCKTLAGATLPAYILDFDFEGGGGTLMPWLRTSRKWDNLDQVKVYTDAERQAAFELLNPGLQKISPIRPGAFIDIVYFDVTKPRSWEIAVRLAAGIDTSRHSSVMVDSLQELAEDVKMSTRGLNLSQEELLQSEIQGRNWGTIQDLTGMFLRYIRGLRDKGIFVYFTAGEQIDKDYVTDPRSQAKGEKEEPYSVKGSVWVPGKMVNTAIHGVDILIHARPGSKLIESTGELVNDPVWVTQPEPISAGSSVYWDAKDRYGRLDRYMKPNFMTILSKIYGVENAKLIYGASRGTKK